MSQIMAISKQSDKFPRYLAVGNAIFFCKPDATNVNRDPDHKWNAGYAVIQSIMDLNNEQAKLTVPLKKIQTITVTSNSYPGDKGPFEITLDEVVWLFRSVDDMTNENEYE